MDGFDQAPTLLVNPMVMDKGHTFFYVGYLIHDYWIYFFVCSEDHAIAVLPQAVQDLPFIIRNVRFWKFRLLAVVSTFLTLE